jgi:hypothetical protein
VYKGYLLGEQIDVSRISLSGKVGDSVVNVGTYGDG